MIFRVVYWGRFVCCTDDWSRECASRRGHRVRKEEIISRTRPPICLSRLHPLVLLVCSAE